VVSWGFQWSLGMGENISVWNQPWLRDHGYITPSTELHIMWEELKETHLLKPNIEQWNRESINYVFYLGTTHNILETPLLPSVRVDVAAWMFENMDFAHFVVLISFNRVYLRFN